MRWSDIPRHPTVAMLRQFAALCVLFCGYLAWQTARSGHGAIAWSLAGLGGTMGLLGIARPSLLRPIFVGWMIAVFPIGYLVSRLILAVVFHAVFTPMAVLFRALGRDALGLRRQTSSTTYWRVKATPADVTRYYRPF